ncbi:unnamed protein product [Adineta steineri]|uniref:Uncharacterized protein n=1 Tax=Adineta steineri TaxID=433720 RepID=A0A813ZPI1_9BILA|nr:unnamed protein product [Adineta steineri]CAF1210114.1 unnamed protein product [Adineta steineri]
MSDHNEEQRKRRQRRRRIQSAPFQSSNDTFDPSRYTKHLIQRLRDAELIDDDDKPIVAKQTRHIHNYQHAIPFRQQLIEQIIYEIKDIERKIHVDLKIQEDVHDKQVACTLRQAEAVHQKKVREMELLNNRDTIRKIIEGLLEENTPEAQRNRIHKLEKKLRQLRQEHNELVERVNQNATKCDNNQTAHDDQINELKKRFDDYRIEINQYTSQTMRTIGDLERRLERLREKQDEHGIAIKDLSLQRDTLNKLAQQIEEIINARHSDLNQLNKFIERLDEINHLFNQVQAGLYPLSKIPSLEREIEKIRNLLIEPNVFNELESRVSQAQRDIISHNGELTQFNEKLTTFDLLYRELKKSFDRIQINDLSAMQQYLRTIDSDLKQKSLEINQLSTLARTALNQINELHTSLTNINEKLADLENKIFDIENFKSRLDKSELKSDDSRFAEIFEEQKRLRHRLDNLIDQERRLNDLANAANEIQRPLDQLTTSDPTNQDNTHARDQAALEDYLKQVKEQIMDTVSTLMQQLIEQINKAKVLISICKTKLDHLLNTQKQNRLEISQSKPPSKSRLFPYVEALQPTDLLQDIWT